MVRREGPSRPTQLPTCTNTNAPDLSAIRPPSPERRSCAPPRLARRSCLRSQHSLNLHTSEQKGSGGGGTLGRMPPPHVSPEPAACLSATVSTATSRHGQLAKLPELSGRHNAPPSVRYSTVRVWGGMRYGKGAERFIPARDG